MYESSDSQFFRTAAGIQSGSDAFDESRLVITYFNNLRARYLLCNFRLVLKGKSGKDISKSLSF